MLMARCRQGAEEVDGLQMRRGRAAEEAQGKLAKIVQVGEHVVGLREWLT